MPAYALDLERLGVSFAGRPLEGFDASRAFVSDCIARFGDCSCDDCTRINLQYALGLFDGGEIVRVDVTDAVIDAIALRNNPPALIDVYDDWNALGMSDPVHLAPLELRF